MRKSDYGGRVRPSSPFKKRRKPTSFIYSKTRTFVRSTRSALRSCSAIFSSLDEYVGHGEVYDHVVSLHLLRTSHVSRSCLPALLLYPLHPYIPIATPLPSIRSHTTTIFAVFSALGHTTNANYEFEFVSTCERDVSPEGYHKRIRGSRISFPTPEPSNGHQVCVHVVYYMSVQGPNGTI